MCATVAGPIEGRPQEAASVARAPAEHRLAPGALGLTQVLFCIVTGAAPLAAMMFNVPVAVLGSGYAVPAAFIVATVVLTIFSVGYIEMSRRVTAAGGFYTFITRGLGPVMGLGSGVLITLCYMIFSAAVIGTLGYFASGSVDDWLGIDLPGWVYSFLGLAVISLFGFFHIELTAKVLGIALVSEVIALLVLAVAVIASGGADGLDARPLNPVDLFSNATAIQAFGASAVGIAIFAAFWSWVGFEMAPNYAEESREPKRIAKVATYGSVIGLGIFYVFISWVFVMGFGDRGVGDGVNQQFQGKTASAFYLLSDRYVGGGLTFALELLIITSSFACAMAFYNTSARYLFSLAREGALPRRLATTHPTRHSPTVASLLVTAFAGLWILGFTIYDPSTEASFLKLGTWSPLLGVLGILAVQAIACVAIVRYFLTEARDGFHPWRTLVAPALGFLAQVGACYLLIANRGALAGAGDVPFIQVLPYVPLVMFLGGIALALYLRARKHDAYARIGRFEAPEEAVDEAHVTAPATAGAVA